DLPALGAADRRRRSDVLGQYRAGAAHRRGTPREHPAVARRDGEQVSDPRPRADMSRIAVVGGGAWGTALADLLARKGDSVTLWAREPEVVDAVNRQHANPVFLPGAALAPNLRADGD